MEVFYVDCTLENMTAQEKSTSIKDLLVDSGSEFTWLPSDVLSSVEIKVRKRNEQFVMANGEIVRRDIGYGILRVNGFETVDEIVFGHEGDLSLLGARTLEGFGAVVDARRKMLVAAGPHLAAVCCAVANISLKAASYQLAPLYEAIN